MVGEMLIKPVETKYVIWFKKLLDDTGENTGMTIWNEYYLECINGDNFSYVKKELCVPLKAHVMPGEKISVKVEFATPPIEGIYTMVWQIMKKDGTPAFAKNRRLEVLLNLI